MVLGFLTEADIREATANEGLLQNHVDAGFDTWSYNLRMGGEAYVSSQRTVASLKPGDTVSILPGETALLLTEERVQMPLDMAAFITLRLAKKRKGLINVSGFHVDPDFKGKLLFSVYNAGPEPVLVRQGEHVFSIYFVRLSKPAARRKSNSVHQDIHSIRSEWAEDIAGPAVSLHSVNERLLGLQYKVTAMIWLFGGILLAALGTLLTLIVVGKGI